MKILVINAGSSSVKYQLFDMDGEQVLAKGVCDRIGIDGGGLKHMVDDPHPVPDGMEGVVRLVDDAGQIHVGWENGSELAVIPGVDKFEKI